MAKAARASGTQLLDEVLAEIDRQYDNILVLGETEWSNIFTFMIPTAM